MNSTMSSALHIRTILRTALSHFGAARLAVMIYMIASVVLGAFVLLLAGVFHANIWIAFTAAMLVHLWLSIGLSQISLAASKGEPIHVYNLFTAPHRVLLIGLIILVPIALGMLLLVVPGIYLAMIWSQSLWLLLDDRAHQLDALSLSAKMTEGNRWNVFKTFFIVGLFDIPARIIIEMVEPHTFLGASLLIVAGLWILVMIAFMPFVGAALYQQLLTCHRPARIPAETGALEFKPS